MQRSACWLLFSSVCVVKLRVGIFVSFVCRFVFSIVLVWIERGLRLTEMLTLSLHCFAQMQKRRLEELSDDVTREELQQMVDEVRGSYQFYRNLIQLASSSMCVCVCVSVCVCVLGEGLDTVCSGGGGHLVVFEILCTLCASAVMCVCACACLQAFVVVTVSMSVSVRER
jgi:hypothetical protein